MKIMRKRTMRKIFKKKQNLEDEIGLIKNFDGLACENIQKLQANISFASVHDSIKVIGVTSANRSEGKSTTVCNLANIYAEKGKKVCIVNLDIRRPSLYKILKVKNVVGVVEYVRGEADLSKVIQHSGKIDVIAAGSKTPFPAKIIQAPEMKELISILREKYDYVILDTTPLLAVSDALYTVPLVDGFLMVCTQHETRKRTLVAAVELLNHAKANIIGIVMTKVTEYSSGENDGYGYGYYYNSYAETTNGTKSKNRR